MMKRERGAVGMIAALILIEVGARLWLGGVADEAQFARYASYRQLEVRYGQPPLDIHRTLAYTGVQEVQRGESYQNFYGWRGAEIESPKPEDAFRIVVVGGSAVYGAGVSADAETFPAQLEAALHAAGYADVEVINAGMLAYASWEELLNVQFRVLDLEPDLIVAQAGYEDIAARLVWPPEAYRGDNSGYLLPPGPFEPAGWESSTALRLLGVRLGWAEPYYDLTVKWRLRAPSAYDLELLEQVRTGSYPSGVFAETGVAAMLAANAPVYFRNNMESLALVAGVNGVPLALVSQPARGLYADEASVGAAYTAALAEHNAILGEVAGATGSGFFDLAGRLGDEAGFYADGTNLTAAGNAAWARLMGEWLVENGYMP